jgi:two-component system, NarL family, nitrate/nitrite response regulator NarL
MPDVFIAAEVRLYREALAETLERKSSLSVIGTAADPGEFHPRVSSRSNALLLVDVASEKGRRDLARFLSHNPSLPVVALGVAQAPHELIAWVEAGVAGYVTRDSSLTELVAAVSAAERGEFTCSPLAAGVLARRLVRLAAHQRAGTAAAGLTRRELEIVSLLGDRLGNQQIANRLCISYSTVKNHVHNILRKLEVQRREEVAVWFAEQRMTEINDDAQQLQAR